MKSVVHSADEKVFVVINATERIWGGGCEELGPRWQGKRHRDEPADQRELETLLTHELVHIYHTQVHPAFDAVAMDPIGWFVEGVATYASGQWDAERQARLQPPSPKFR